MIALRRLKKWLKRIALAIALLIAIPAVILAIGVLWPERVARPVVTATPVFIRHVTVVAVERGTLIPAQSVLIERGRIVSVPSAPTETIRPRSISTDCAGINVPRSTATTVTCRMNTGVAVTTGLATRSGQSTPIARITAGMAISSAIASAIRLSHFFKRRKAIIHRSMRMRDQAARVLEARTGTLEETPYAVLLVALAASGADAV